MRQQLLGRQALVGFLQLDPTPDLLNVAGRCGCDFIMLDGEHGTLAEEDYARSLRAHATTDVLALVRLSGHDPQASRRYLDMGADAIVVPHVSTAEEAQLMVRAIASYESASLIVLLESALGAANAEEILALEGVEGAFVGPNDLAADLGCSNDHADSTYAQALTRIERAAAMTGKMLGTVPHGRYSLQALHARGHRLFVLGTDRSLIHEAMSTQVTKARSSLDNH